MSAPARPLTGRCLCGDVRFRLEGEPHAVEACHCTQCQRWSGPYLSVATVRQDELVLENGHESLAWYPSSDHAERGFCVLCGSSLFWRRSDPGAPDVDVSLGALDQPTGLTVEAHIYADDAGDTYQVPQDAPRFAGRSGWDA